MESICRLCFQPAALFQVPGYNLPTCAKCSEHLTTNGLSTTFYQSVRTDGTASQPQPANGVSSEGGLLQQHQVPQSQHISTPPQDQNSTGDHSNSSVSSNQQTNQNNQQDSGKKDEVMPFDLEKTIQNLDVDLLFNEEGSCPLCSKTFSRKSSLLTHIRNHSAERKYVCTYCQKGFTQAANLRNHERIHTNDRPYVCIDCGKAFTQITNLNNHRRLHTGERPFVCIEPECGRSFAQVTNLNNHMKTHHKVQQYCCNQCPKKFTQVTSLNQHLQAHAGITGFYCPRCPEKTFKQQSQLHTHMKTHGLAFPFECQKCDEKFLQQAHLDQHNKMHDEFKFKCDMCPSSFNQEILLKKHVQRHIEGRYITCPVANCNQGFAVKQHLSKHLLTRHSHSELPPPKRSKKPQLQQTQPQQHHQPPLQHAIHLVGNSITTPHPIPGRGRPPKKKVNVISNTPILLQSISIKQEPSGMNDVQSNGNITAVQLKSSDIIAGNNHDASDSEDTKCHDCGVIFPNENDLRDHIFYKHPERRFMQAVIEENKYLMRMQSQQNYVCNLCCNVFKSHLSLVRHTAKFHGQLL